ncbi:MAG: DEAD/DEAH box helicase, partial [Reichenbachiella sp.]
MSHQVKDQAAILAKLNITSLNEMQTEALETMRSHDEMLLLSPTGSGKTLAYLLPVLEMLDKDVRDIQALILVPTRELAIQIEQVMREMGTGFKVNAVYGGRSGSQDRLDLKHTPAVLVGTPGRVADRFRRDSFSLDAIKCLVLDEFDKSLEVGFETEMKEIIDAIPNLKNKILTSATQGVEVPSFVRLSNQTVLDYLHLDTSQLEVKTVLAQDKDKLEALVNLVCQMGDQPGIVFCNFKDSIEVVSDYLLENRIGHGSFNGGMEQMDRERTLIKFRNGTYRLIIATDLAARGLDIPELKYIVHYELPKRSQEFTHRNGRTARMNSEGTAYVLKWGKENLPDFIESKQEIQLSQSASPKATGWTTLHITGGRRDKISKGDIAGLFFKQGGLEKDELGMIELKPEASYVAVKTHKAQIMIDT